MINRSHGRRGDRRARGRRSRRSDSTRPGSSWARPLALAVELWLTRVVLLAGSVLVLHTALHGTLEALPSILVTLGAIAAAGTLYGALTSGGERRRDVAAGPEPAGVRPAADRRGALLQRGPARRCTAASGGSSRSWPWPYTWHWGFSFTVFSRNRDETAAQRLLGPVTLVTMALTIWLGLWVTPPDKVQGNLVRLLYVHPAIAWVALYLSFGTATIASALYLWRRTRSIVMDRVAHCAMEVSLVFIVPHAHHRLDLGPTGVGRVVGLGRATHLDRDPRRPRARLPRASPRQRRRRTCARGAAPSSRSSRRSTCRSIHFSVQWWHTLHQGATLLGPNRKFNVHGSMLWTMLLSFVALHPRLRVAAARALPTRGEA